MSKSIKLQHPSEDKVREINTEGFNFGGLILGPVLYFGWGMWKKGLLLLGAYFLVFILTDIVIAITGETSLAQSGGLGFIVSLYCAFAINKDNYKYLLNKGWKPVDKKVKLDGSASKEKKRFPVVWIVVAILAVFAFFSWIGESNQDTQWNAEKAKRIAECEEMYGGGKYCECTIDYLEKKVGVQGIVEINNKFKNDKKIPPIIVEAGQACQEYFDETNTEKINQYMQQMEELELS